VITGPVFVAVTNFSLSFGMLRLEPPEAFGTFAFLLAAAWFTVGISSAMFGAPMQALHIDEEQPAAAGIVTAIISVATAAALVAAPAFAMLGFALGLSLSTCACYGIFVTLTILRTVGRSWSYTKAGAKRVAISDISYAGTTLATFALTLAWANVAAAPAAYIALALGSAAGAMSFGNPFVALLRLPDGQARRRYATIWRQQSRWSLLGTVATELMANAHIYLLTFLGGAAALAPVAATALLVRPINVVQNAMIEYERPQIALFLAQGAMGEVDRSVFLFRSVLLLAWCATAALAAAILAFRPESIFPPSYDLATVRLASVLWLAVWLVIIVQIPVNVLLQAGGDFRILAAASLAAAATSVAGVLIAIAAAKPVWTVAAMVPGWLVSSVIIERAARKDRRRRSPPYPSAESA
jgi:hypothetical protein